MYPPQETNAEKSHDKFNKVFSVFTWSIIFQNKKQVSNALLFSKTCCRAKTQLTVEKRDVRNGTKNFVRETIFLLL